MPNHALFLGFFWGVEPLNIVGRDPNPQKASLGDYALFKP